MNFLHCLIGTSLTVSTVISYPLATLALETTQIKDIANNITVFIEITDFNGDQSHGSGVIIAREDSTYYVLTSKHVVKHQEDDYQYTISTHDGESHALDNDNIRHIQDVDLAVVSFQSDRIYKVAQIAATAIEPGIPIYVNGFPKAGQEIQTGSQFTEGIITGINQQHRTGYNLVYDNFTREGMSGAPVLNAQGKLIGIHGLAEQESPECQQAEAIDNHGLPPQTDEFGNEIASNACLTVSTTVEKIDLNLGISIETFLKKADSIGVGQILDTTTVNQPKRPQIIETQPDTDSGCSGVSCL
jgi:serine protease Do